jgi:hypothetical protein
MPWPSVLLALHLGSTVGQLAAPTAAPAFASPRQAAGSAAAPSSLLTPAGVARAASTGLLGDRVDCVCALSIVRTRHLLDESSDSIESGSLGAAPAPRSQERGDVLSTTAGVHRTAVLAALRAANRKDSVAGSAPASTAPKAPELGRGLAGLSATGGSVWFRGGHTAGSGAQGHRDGQGQGRGSHGATVEVDTALAGAHYADGDDGYELAVALQSASLAAGAAGLSVAASDAGPDDCGPYGVVSAAALDARLRRRPVYLTRTRYETNKPAFEQWLRLRLSALTAHTHVVVTLWSCLADDSALPLAAGSLHVGAAFPTCRYMSQHYLAWQRGVSVAGRPQLALAFDEGPQQRTPGRAGRRGSAGSGGAPAMVAPGSVIPHPAYVFDLAPVPVGTPLTEGAAALVTPAPIEPPSGRASSSQLAAFVARADVDLARFDARGRLLAPAAAGTRGKTQDQALGVVGAAAHLGNEGARAPGGSVAALAAAAAFTGLAGSAQSLGATPAPAAAASRSGLRLTLHWRADVDADPVAVRGALVLRSVGVTAGSPLAAMEPASLRQIGAAASPAAVKYADIVSCLPVLEPLFRCMAEPPSAAAVQEQRQRAQAAAASAAARGNTGSGTGSPGAGGGGFSSPQQPGRRLSVVGMMAAQRMATGMLSKVRTGKKAASAIESLRSPAAGAAGSRRQGAGGNAGGALGADPLSDGEGSGGEGGGGSGRGAAPRGLSERVFVGVCAHCTTLPEAALRTAFRQLDANGDADLLWCVCQGSCWVWHCPARAGGWFPRVP